jgi:lipoprotein-releasing system permease protein
MMVIDKTKEIAILRTMGLKSRTVMYVFMTEGLWCGLIGTVFGTLIGLICALYLNEILQFLGVAHMFLLGQKLPVLIEPLQIAAVILCSVMLTTIATIYPAYKAAQILPAEALRYE